MMYILYIAKRRRVQRSGGLCVEERSQNAVKALGVHATQRTLMEVDREGPAADAPDLNLLGVTHV